MPLTFPHQERFVDPYEGLSFIGADEANGRVQCHIEIQALRDHFEPLATHVYELASK